MRVPENARLYRLGSGAAPIVGPALLFLNVIHPEEFSRGNEAQQLAAIAVSALLLLGGFWAGFAILRLGDAKFAAGRA